MSRNMTTGFHYTPAASTSGHISTSKQTYIDITKISKNATSQYNAAKKINSAMEKLSEIEQMMEITTDDSMKLILLSKIAEEQKIISEQKTQINKLKRYGA
ncbi:unnamed protein product [Rhizophagus irregularis]|nr:unnamed protein product [Rhizophagus irregularis]CAB4440920.1 unnamed protein product [Rhizophagus irregularis]